jgi:hypothetical protein
MKYMLGVSKNTKINAAAIRAEKNLFQIVRGKIEQK